VVSNPTDSQGRKCVHPKEAKYDLKHLFLHFQLSIEEKNRINYSTRKRGREEGT
jgi:hypothetical protein